MFCRWCNTELSPNGHRCYGTTVCRFYFADGRVMHIGLMNPPPYIWSLCDDYPGQRRLELREVMAGAPMPRSRVVTFRRRDYGYPDDFIGPHRNSDYHEDPEA